MAGRFVKILKTAGKMGLNTIYKYLILSATLLFGACTSSGIIPADMNLSVVNVTVTQSGEVNEGGRFLHELGEEVRYEFSKAEQGEKEARIFLEVRELTYKDSSLKGYKQGLNQMVTYGRLVDGVTGESMGEFPLKVVSDDVGADASSRMGRERIQSDLTGLMATATLEKIYGKRRAGKISERLAAHERQPYLVKITNPVQLGSLPGYIASSLPASVIFAPPTHEAVGDNKPKVIDAPQLPVQ